MPESPAATERRRQHEKMLDRVGGPGSDAGQRLLDRWHKEDVANRRPMGRDGLAGTVKE